jgi:hypothetical protein
MMKRSTAGKEASEKKNHETTRNENSNGRRVKGAQLHKQARQHGERFRGLFEVARHRDYIDFEPAFLIEGNILFSAYRPEGEKESVCKRQNGQTAEAYLERREKRTNSQE